MAEEISARAPVKPDIAIKKCVDGFLVAGNQYGGDDLRAFSTAEGLIEWLSRELGAGPIVWALTLEIWGEELKVLPEDLLPTPDQMTDPSGFQRVIEDNARFLLNRFVEAELEKRAPKPKPKPKPEKRKKLKKAPPKEEAIPKGSQESAKPTP